MYTRVYHQRVDSKARSIPKDSFTLQFSIATKNEHHTI